MLTLLNPRILMNQVGALIVSQTVTWTSPSGREPFCVSQEGSVTPVWFVVHRYSWIRHGVD